MSVNFIFLLLFTGLFSLFLPQKRLKIIWPAILLATMGYALFSIVSPYSGKELSFIWNAIPNLPVSIVFNPWKIGSFGIFEILLLTALAMYYNIISSDEEYSNSLCGLIIFNSIFVIMAFCSVNYIQLLAAIGMADVIVYGIINNLEAKRYYIYGNFVADFVMMSILALILAQQGKVDIANLEEYTKAWHHRDFIAIMLILSIFIKSGFAFFHTAYQKMSTLNFNRLNFVLFASTPLMGVITFLLLNSILTISKYSFPILLFGSYASLCWGGLGYLTADNIKRKAIYNAMIVWGLSFAGIILIPSFSLHKFFMFIISAFLFNTSLQAICQSSEQSCVSKISSFYKFPQVIFVINMVAACLYVLSWMVFAWENLYLCLSGMLLILLISATTASETYLSVDRVRKKQKVEKFILIGAPIVSIFTVFLIENADIKYIYAYTIIISAVWLILLLTWPLRFLQKTYQISAFQNVDIPAKIYTVLISVPLQAIGRVLRVAVDFIFLERTLIASIKNSIRFFVFIFKILNNHGVLGKIFFILLGAAIFVAVYYNGVVR